MSEIFVTVIYCDDIRMEMGGKHSFMGVYNSDLVVPELPTTLLKLCVHVTVRIPLDSEAETLFLRVLMNEEVLSEVPVPDGELRKMFEAPDPTGDSTQLSVVLALQFASLQLSTVGVIRVRAIVDGDEIKGNSLRIRTPLPNEPTMLLTS